MTPWEFLLWCLAISLAVVVIGFAVAITVAMVRLATKVEPTHKDDGGS